jgi:hypothetical protein
VNRCKLVSPVLLQLNRPMLSPVKETEFLIYGVKEHTVWRMQIFSAGIAAGLVIASMIIGIARLLK